MTFKKGHILSKKSEGKRIQSLKNWWTKNKNSKKVAKRNTKIISTRRKNNKIWCTDEHKKKIGLANKGKISWSKGKSKKTNKSILKQSISVRKTMLKMWQDEKFAKKMLKAMKLKPNKAETYLETMLNNHLPKQYKYVGDGKVWLGGFCPDFTSNNSKKLIELFGDFWHKNTKERDKRRLQAYKKFGYETLIIWEHELQDKAIVIKKIKDFTNEISN